MAKQDDYVRYTIRVPADLYARLQEAAGEKSINAEIVERLELTSDTTFAKIIRDLEQAEIKLFEQAKAEKALLKTIDQQEKTIRGLRKIIVQDAKIQELKDSIIHNVEATRDAMRDTLRSVEFLANMYRKAVDQAAKGDTRNLDALLEMHRDNPMESYDEPSILRSPWLK